MARCHRIGQTRPVVVYKLCTKGTIDERILKRGEVKRKLEKIVISKEASKLNLNDYNSVLELKRLLESSEHEVVTSEKDVFTPEELDKLLDRSDLEVQDKHLQESVSSLDSTDEQSQEE
ncbi:lymphocyte-specific helicase-like [Cephus cinctus]|uniref:Lymphocyte-specific helicase-like n=1 Tax=Cephus cinctus TaxID=211228 RepID=A0AAJ7CBN9_CEPCN|nr:lymphocyte-specific helicase-like [Cephus cinctus]